MKAAGDNRLIVYKEALLRLTAGFYLKPWRPEGSGVTY